MTTRRPALRTLRQRIDTTAWDLVARRAPHRLGPARPSWAAARLGAELQRLDDQRRNDPRHLAHAESSSGSQNGEDGVIAEIFDRIGEGGRTFVEFGAADGSENCTTALAATGWSGVWIEGDGDLVERARRHVAGGSVNVVEAFIDRDNIVGLLRSGGAPEALDLLVVDIDGNDHDVLAAVLEAHEPRVLVAEYRAAVGPRSHWTMPYDPAHTWNEDWRFGVSLAALSGLASRHGLRLVGCDSRGVNAFFVTEAEARPFTSRTVTEHWVPPIFHLPYGHPPRRWDGFAGAPLSGAAASLVEIDRVDITTPTIRAGGPVVALVTVRNGSDLTIGESDSTPVRVAHVWTDPEGQVGGEPTRSIQRWRAGAGEIGEVVMVTEAPARPGRWHLDVGLVQDDVRWIAHPALDPTRLTFDVS